MFESYCFVSCKDFTNLVVLQPSSYRDEKVEFISVIPCSLSLKAITV